MIDLSNVQESARKAFPAQLRDKVDFLASDSCRPYIIEGKLQEINAIIEAGRHLAITDAQKLNEEELKELEKDLLDLKVLKMNEELRQHLIVILASKGIKKEIFQTEVARERY